MTFLDDKQAEWDDLIDAHERENGILKFRPMEISDIELAVFALGRFVQYRLDEGMDAANLEDFMQAYLNLTASLDGREPLDLHELPSRIEAAGLTAQPEDPPAWPSWLIGHERLRGHLRAQHSARNTAVLDVQSKHDPSLGAHLKIIWLYDGPGAVQVKATPYRRVHYSWFRDNPGADSVMVSPSMLLERLRSAPETIQEEYTSTANRDFTSSETANGNSDSTNAQALSKTPEAPIVSKSTETPRQEITEDTMN